jgi:hypothetical protein
MTRRCAAVIALALVARSAPAMAQNTLNNEQVMALIEAKIAELRGAQAPLEMPVATQRFGVDGSGSAANSVDLVRGPSLPDLFALAFENNVVAFGKGKTTVSINPFLFASWANPAVLDRPSLYRQHAGLRRVAGSLTFGGAGEAFDRDADGVADAAATAESPLEIVTWEVQWRVRGSRDRREAEHFDTFVAAVHSVFQTSAAAFATFMDRWKQTIADMSVPSGEVREAEFQAFLEREDVEASLLVIAQADTAVLRASQEAIARIDRSMVWTVTAGATHQGDEFGPDRFRLGVKGVWSFLTGPVKWDSTVNASYVHAGSIGGILPDGDSFIAGWKAGTKLLKTHALIKEGIDWSASLSGEFYDDVPGAKHDAIVKAGTTLSLNFTKSVSIPLTVSYANHRDLLTSSSKVFGHIGLSYDFSSLSR